MSRQVVTRVTAALVAVCALAAAIVGVSGAPASAHNNGGATPLIQAFTLSPAGSGWNANVQIVDSDQGTPVRGASVVAITGTKQNTLNPTSTLGGYAGTLTGVAPGPQDVTLQIKSLPGNDPVNPFHKTWNITLAAGQPTAIVAGSGGGGGSHLGLILGVAGAVVVLAMLYGLFSVRRRTAVPAQAKATRA